MIIRNFFKRIWWKSSKLLRHVENFAYADNPKTRTSQDTKYPSMAIFAGWLAPFEYISENYLHHCFNVLNPSVFSFFSTIRSQDPIIALLLYKASETALLNVCRLLVTLSRGQIVRRIAKFVFFLYLINWYVRICVITFLRPVSQRFVTVKTVFVFQDFCPHPARTSCFAVIYKCWIPFKSTFVSIVVAYLRVDKFGEISLLHC